VVIQKFWRGYAARVAVKIARETNKQMNKFLKEKAFYTANNAGGFAYYGKDLAKFKQEGIAAAINLADKAGKATPVPPLLSVFEEFIAKMEQEFTLYSKRLVLEKSMDVMALDEAIGVLIKLKISDEYLSTLKWRSENMAVQASLLNALKTLDVSIAEIDIDDSQTTMQFKNVIDAVLDAKLTVEEKLWVDPEGAKMFAKAWTLYKDCEKKNAERLKQQELEKQKETERKKKYEEEQ